MNFGERIKIRESAGEITAHIKMRNNPLLFFLPVWLAFWTYGGITSIKSILNGDAAAAGFLIFWLPGEIVGVGTWLWIAFGREIVSIGEGTFTYKRELFGYVLTKRVMPVRELSNMRVERMSGWASLFHNSSDQLGFGRGSVAVEQGWDTHRFGAWLDEGEALALVAELKRHLPDSIR